MYFRMKRRRLFFLASVLQSALFFVPSCYLLLFLFLSLCHSSARSYQVVFFELLWVDSSPICTFKHVPGATLIQHVREARDAFRMYHNEETPWKCMFTELAECRQEPLFVQTHAAVVSKNVGDSSTSAPKLRAQQVWVALCPACLSWCHEDGRDQPTPVASMAICPAVEMQNSANGVPLVVQPAGVSLP